MQVQESKRVVLRSSEHSNHHQVEMSRRSQQRNGQPWKICQSLEERVVRCVLTSLSAVTEEGKIEGAQVVHQVDVDVASESTARKVLVKYETVGGGLGREEAAELIGLVMKSALMTQQR